MEFIKEKGIIHFDLQKVKVFCFEIKLNYLMAKLLTKIPSLPFLFLN